MLGPTTNATLCVQGGGSGGELLQQKKWLNSCTLSVPTQEHDRVYLSGGIQKKQNTNILTHIKHIHAADYGD